MPFLYERPVSKRVTFIHRITWLDAVLWGAGMLLMFIGWCAVGVCKALWWVLCALYALVTNLRLRRGWKDGEL